MKNTIFIILLLIVNRCNSQRAMKSIHKKDMVVSWFYSPTHIHFEICAPTKGWATIGFNTTSSIKNTYLLMGNVTNSKPNVVEHYTLSPGNYKSFPDLKIKNNVIKISGIENRNQTKLFFSIPIIAIAPYKPILAEGKTYVMLMAYSLEDDFQHHSIMRTSKKIKL